MAFAEYCFASLAVCLSAKGKALAAASCRRRRAGRWFAGDRFASRRGLRLGRRFGLLFAGSAGIEEIAALANGLNAAVSIGALAFFANQRADAVGLAANGIERIKTCDNN